jgi:hypothetical protein
MMSESSFGSNCKTATAGIAAAMTQAANAGMMSSSFNQQGVRSMTQAPWYSKPSSGHQGLIISEATGANVAVSYDQADGPLIAAAPDLLEALQHVYAVAIQLWGHSHNDSCLREAAAAIAKATE